MGLPGSGDVGQISKQPVQAVEGNFTGSIAFLREFGIFYVDVF